MAKQTNAWDQLPGETDLWYDRFEIYRQLGAIRSVSKTYQIAKREDPERITGNTPGSNWHEKASEYRWAERARAYDQAERARFKAEEEEISADRRRTRIQMINELQAESFAGLKTANLGALDEVQARVALPQLRLLLLGLLAAERAEFGMDGVAEGDNQENVLDDALRDNIAKVWGNNGEPSAP